jgi:tRNA (cytidine/uridine-2'-O-)-methyltransferase
MFHIILYEPEIPPNAGNIIRLSVNTGCNLHFIEPLGFTLDEKGYRRAGMDYMKKKNVNIWPNLDNCIQNTNLNKIYSISTKGEKRYSDITYREGDAFIFGPESRGLPSNIREKYSSLYIPMKSDGRSLNLANAVSIIVYEGWSKNNFQ